ncbi:entry exclusion lipoprotein TrbK [Pseudomonas sp. BT-42-2]|jgi:entry exclusion lipoprotein TrbK|nr:entry exclusion lipoprotein TrbK [Pseudomonas sp. BT-42-2]MCV9920462.1 entry exclusion lipoprotein TrbK [Pseudomonas sp. BT-42-2]
MAFSSVALLEVCSTSQADGEGANEEATDSAAYAVSSEHCQPNYLKTLPDNKARENLVEQCMTGGSFKKSERKTW